MLDPIEFDPAVLSPWPVGRRPCALPEAEDAEVLIACREAVLETKAAEQPSPAEALQALCNDMQAEMRLQFEAFRKIRVDAEKLLEGSPDDAEVKIAKADIKSANDALSLIVRTLEKIDSLQRSLADDLSRADEQHFDQRAYDELLAGIERKIEARARELAAEMVGGRDPEAAGDSATGPP